MTVIMTRRYMVFAGIIFFIALNAGVTMLLAFWGVTHPESFLSGLLSLIGKEMLLVLFLGVIAVVLPRYGVFALGVFSGVFIYGTLDPQFGNSFLLALFAGSGGFVGHHSDKTLEKIIDLLPDKKPAPAKMEVEK